jgi:IrrE N-terminal-like domain
MSNTHDPNEPVLARLRALMPPRRLMLSDALAVAEAQARLIRKRLGDRPVSVKTLTTLFPCLRVVTMSGMPFSGSAHWTDGEWLVALNADEPAVRRRFSLGHELKHIIDHPLHDVLYPSSVRSSGRLRERIADYFSGCLLMDKRTVKRLFWQGLAVAQIAEALNVSTRAVEVRLAQLGLDERPGPTCHRLPTSRYLPMPTGVAA